MLASGYRGAKGIPFDELEGAGMVGLVESARDWNGSGNFGNYSNTSIRNNIRDFIRAWNSPEELVAVPGSESGADFYEWQSWSDREFIYAIAEKWEHLASTPEETVIAYDLIKGAGAAIKSAIIGFSKRERHILNARYFTNPPSSIETIARHHKISYARTVFLIDRMLKKIKAILDAREPKIKTTRLRNVPSVLASATGDRQSSSHQAPSGLQDTGRMSPMGD
jgi:hypothetical protein